MIRMLHIVGAMAPSGIGNYIMNIYRYIDREKVQFDFIVHELRPVNFDSEIEAMGGRLYYVTRKSVSPFKNFSEIKKIVKDGAYRVVFRHTDTSTVALDLFAARLGGAANRIPHSHSTSTKGKSMHRIFQPFLNAVSTDRFACSLDAGKWLYGNREFKVIKNGIDADAFKFVAEKRKKLREKEGLSGCKVFGHVGNFLPVKNHLFLLDIFASLTRLTDQKICLLLVGDGALKPEIIKRAEEQGIKKYIIFAGVRNDTADLLQVMDLFFFPSFYEGMPIALVEAQAAGLPCVVSDTVTKDVVLTDLVKMLALSDAPEIWAKQAWELLQLRSADRQKYDTRSQIISGGFGVKELAEFYENYVFN